MRHQLLHATAMLTGAAIGIGIASLLAFIFQLNDLVVALGYGASLLLIPIVICAGLSVAVRYH